MKATGLFIVLYCISAGCATIPSPSPAVNSDGDTEEYVVESYCAPVVSAQPEARTAMSPTHLTVRPAQKTADGLLFLSSSTRQIAQIIGIEDLVSQIPLLEREGIAKCRWSAFAVARIAPGTF